MFLSRKAQGDATRLAGAPTNFSKFRHETARLMACRVLGLAPVAVMIHSAPEKGCRASAASQHRPPPLPITATGCRDPATATRFPDPHSLPGERASLPTSPQTISEAFTHTYTRTNRGMCLSLVSERLLQRKCSSSPSQGCLTWPDDRLGAPGTPPPPLTQCPLPAVPKEPEAPSSSSQEAAAKHLPFSFSFQLFFFCLMTL